MDYAIITPIIVGIVQGAKASGLPSKFAWLLAALLGLGYGLAVNPTLEGAIMGLAAGLAASGLYEGFNNGKKAIVAMKSQ